MLAKVLPLRSANMLGRTHSLRHSSCHLRLLANTATRWVAMNATSSIRSSSRFPRSVGHSATRPTPLSRDGITISRPTSWSLVAGQRRCCSPASGCSDTAALSTDSPSQSGIDNLLQLLQSGCRTTAAAPAVWKQVLQPGDLAIDCTCGNGWDTLLLSELVGPTGIVHAIDIAVSLVLALMCSGSHHRLYRSRTSTSGLCRRRLSQRRKGG